MAESGGQRDHLRQRLSEVDRGIVELIAERQRLVDEIGAAKRASGQPTRDFSRERDVIELARQQAHEVGLPAHLVESLMRLLIRASLTHQERARVSAEGQGSGRRVLVIGGAGKMGRWFADFLGEQGFDVEIADPAGPVEGFRSYTRWQETDLAHELIVVAAPLRHTALILEELAARVPRGVIIDVASLKTPIRKALRQAVDAGCRVASIHPMFGPDTELLSGRHVIFVDVGSREALEEARVLFASTMVEQVEMGIDDHDRIIAHVLGLSHALNIIFFNALADSGEAAPRLAEISSTTFDAQLDVSARVARENPHLYYEIQALNEHGGEPLAALGRALDAFRAAVAGTDEAGFVRLMEQGRRYFERGVRRPD